MNTLSILSGVEQVLGTALSASGLTISVILGMPEVGRPLVNLPVAAVTFTADVPQPIPALGRIPAHRDSVQSLVYLFARNEQELLGLVDAMRAVRPVATSVTAEGVTYVLRWGATRRITLSDDEQQLGYVAATELTVLRP